MGQGGAGRPSPSRAWERPDVPMHLILADMFMMGKTTAEVVRGNEACCPASQDHRDGWRKSIATARVAASSTVSQRRSDDPQAFRPAGLLDPIRNLLIQVDSFQELAIA